MVNRILVMPGFLLLNYVSNREGVKNKREGGYSAKFFGTKINSVKGGWGVQTFLILRLIP